MSADNFGVHASHCCVSHGCKYGDENCPVEKGLSLGVVCECCEADALAAKPMEELRDQITQLQSALSASRDECERLRLLLARFDDAYCEVGPELSRVQRTEHRRLIIEVRSALQTQSYEPARTALEATK